VHFTKKRQRPREWEFWR